MMSNRAPAIPRPCCRALGCLTFLLASTLAANPAQEGAEGALGRKLFGPGFSDAHLKLAGWTEVGFTYNDSDHGAAGLGNSPVVLDRDSGLQLNQTYLFFEREIATNILPRVTPVPGPMPQEYSFGWNAGLLYGRDGQLVQTFGWDSRWSVNSPGNYDSSRASENRQNFLVFPQFFLQGYLPWYKGMAFFLGNWMSPFSYEIGFNLEKGPNLLYTHSYALEAAPVKESGLLWAANLANSKGFGLLAMEAGVTRGWSNFNDNNGNPAYNLNLRYRTSDMRTWIDVCSMWGNAQADPRKVDFPASESWRWFGDKANIPATQIISPRGQMRSQFDCTVIHQFTERLKGVFEFNCGKQKGDGALDTIDVLTGPGFKGASWGGVNVEAQYRFSPSFTCAARAETFRDRNGYALYPNTGVHSDMNEVTLGTQYQYNRYVQFRPELRNDWQSNNHGENAFANGTRNKQLSFNADLVVRY